MAHKDDATIIAKTHNTARYFTEQRQVAWVVLLGTVLWGIYGYFHMPQRKDPDIPVITAMVITPWPGMDAARIEERVTRRIEEVVAENDAVDVIRSVTRTGVSYVYVDLKEGTPETGKVFDDIALKLNAINDLPENAGPIQFHKDFGNTAALTLTVASPNLVEGSQFIGVDGATDYDDAALLAHINRFVLERLRVSEFHPDAWPATVIRDPADARAKLLAVAGDKYTYREMDDLTELMKRTFQTVEQVSKVDRFGVLGEQVILSFSQERIASYGVQMGRLRDVLRARNTALSGGLVEVEGRTVALNPTGQFKTE